MTRISPTDTNVSITVTDESAHFAYESLIDYVGNELRTKILNSDELHVMRGTLSVAQSLAESRLGWGYQSSYVRESIQKLYSLISELDY